ncbi:MAG: amidohydrolase [Sphaerochaeta sp.]|nr:amidohydrolase [Sphaerochaeta sp.]
MEAQALKKRAKLAMDRNKVKIAGFGSTLISTPELGFKEMKSSAYVREQLQDLDLEMQEGFAITGIRALLKGSSHHANICLLSELDAVMSPENPMASPDGAAHACGHSTQSTQLYAAAIALSEVQDDLEGDVTFLAVPAEEFLDLEYRLQLRQEGKISYLSGKQEMIKLDIFAGIDMVIMIHAQPNTPAYKVFVGGGSLGFTAKNIRFLGKEAHGASPFTGINALQAAHLAIAGINANRETFSEEERIRIHPILTKGGDVVNTVPSDVRMETYIRGSHRAAIERGCTVVDRCAEAGAAMMGGHVVIETIAGYLPLNQDPLLGEAFAQEAQQVLGEDCIVRGVDMVGSTDMGDLSHLMPCIQPTMGGFAGDAHAKDFKVCDPLRSYLLGGEILANLVIELLKDGCALAKTIRTSFVPLMDRDAYLRYLETEKENMHVGKGKAQ